MKHKKLFFSMMMVAIIVTISVGVSSCNKDEKKEIEVDKSGLIQKKWFNVLQGYRIEFRAKSIYSYKHSKFGNGEGNYKIYETIEEQELRFVDGEVYNATLFKILVSGSMEFNEIWVYYTVSPDPNIVVVFYDGNELLQDDLKFYHIERDGE